MPLTAKGNEIMSAMVKEYGEEKGKEVFYASKNAGKISGVDADEALSWSKRLDAACAAVEGLERRMDELDCARGDAAFVRGSLSVDKIKNPYVNNKGESFEWGVFEGASLVSGGFRTSQDATSELKRLAPRFSDRFS